jgi:hypothetical protein
MGTGWYVAAGVIVALPVLYWVLKVATGLVVPIEKAAAAYFYQRLRIYKIDPFVTPAFIAESVSICLEEATRSTRWSGGGKAQLREAVVKKIDDEAYLIFQWMSGAAHLNDKIYETQRSRYQRHGLPRLPKPV